MIHKRSHALQSLMAFLRVLSHCAVNSRVTAPSSTLLLFSLETSFSGNISFKQEKGSNLNLKKLEVIRCTKSNTEEDLEAGEK